MPPVDFLLDDSQSMLLPTLLPSISSSLSLQHNLPQVLPTSPAASKSEDGPFAQFVTPSPTPPDTPSSRGRTPCSSGQSSPRRYGNASPTKGCDATKEKVPRYKRPSHIKAEHKRRCKIQVNCLISSYCQFMYCDSVLLMSLLWVHSVGTNIDCNRRLIET